MDTEKLQGREIGDVTEVRFAPQLLKKRYQTSYFVPKRTQESMHNEFRKEKGRTWQVPSVCCQLAPLRSNSDGARSVGLVLRLQKNAVKLQERVVGLATMAR
jgi:hypothetical protein